MSSEGSRLNQIQMRYQQKVMHENAQKKSEMYEDTQKLLTSSLGAGKVRAMFDERRSRGAGIDKSYLLEPIAFESNRTTTNSKRQVIGPAAKASTQRITNYSKVIVPPLQNRNNHNDDINGNNYRNAVDDPIDRTFRPRETAVAKAKQPGTKPSTTSVGIKKPSPSVLSSSSVITTSSPLKNVTNQKPVPSRLMKSGNSSSSSGSVRSNMNANSTTRAATNGNSVAMHPKVEKPSSAKSQNSQESFDEVDDDGPVPEGLVKCSICKRNFNEDRLEKHQTICQKTKSKKRKIYDASKKRVQGTEAESYLRKPISSGRAQKAATIHTGGGPKTANWRAKHDDFINTIRAAKQMQAYVAKGGKLSDLPPPPPSENPDYVQCPHCSRRFNEAAASRHIPICQSINKPKPKTSALTTKTNSFAKRR